MNFSFEKLHIPIFGEGSLKFNREHPGVRGDFSHVHRRIGDGEEGRLDQES